jgi:chromosome segregation ATPase
VPTRDRCEEAFALADAYKAQRDRLQEELQTVRRAWLDEAEELAEKAEAWYEQQKATSHSLIGVMQHAESLRQDLDDTQAVIDDLNSVIADYAATYGPPPSEPNVDDLDGPVAQARGI